MTEMICAITREETSSIRDLYEKKLALENLAKIISPNENNELYERLVADYGATVHEFNNWWTDILKKYNLPGDNYIVDFVENQLLRPVQE